MQCALTDWEGDFEDVWHRLSGDVLSQLRQHSAQRLDFVAAESRP